MRKLLLLVVLLLSGIGGLQSQYYIDLGDNVGVDVEQFRASLDTAAKHLVEAFPSTYQDSFRVFSIGYYLHSENFQGSWPIVFERALENARSISKYYLLIGRQSSSSGLHSGFDVSVNLPFNDPFDCLNSSQRLLLNSLLDVYVSNAFKSAGGYPSSYVSAEKAGMLQLESIIESLLMNDCEFVAGGNIPLVLRARGFQSVDIVVGEPITLKPDNDPRRNAGSIDDYALLEIEIEGELVDLSQSYVDVVSETGGVCFVTKNTNITNSNIFSDVENTFLNNSSTNIWFHIYEKTSQNESDSLFVKWVDVEMLEDKFGLDYLFSDFSDLSGLIDEASVSRKYEVDPSGFFIRVESNPELRIIVKNQTSGEIVEVLRFNDPPSDRTMADNWIEFRSNPPEPACTGCTVDCVHLPFLHIVSDDTIQAYYQRTPGLQYKIWGVRHFYARKNSPGENPMWFDPILIRLSLQG